MGFETPPNQEHHEDAGKKLEAEAEALFTEAMVLAKKGPQWYITYENALKKAIDTYEKAAIAHEASDNGIRAFAVRKAIDQIYMHIDGLHTDKETLA